MVGNANTSGWWFRKAKSGHVRSNADGALRTAAGSGLALECAELPPISADGTKLRVGMARVTGAHNLAADHVIHVLGPSSHTAPNSLEDLQRAYTSCFEHADKLHVSTLALPAISCGVYAFPFEIGALAAFRSLDRWSETAAASEGGGDLKAIEFALLDEGAFTTFADMAHAIWGT